MSIPTGPNIPGFGGVLFGGGQEVPSPEQLDWFHQRAGRGRDRMHHFLGLDADDASPGNHTHDGKNSLRIKASDIDGFTSEAGGLLSAFSRANRVRNPDFRVNQRGYASGAALAPQQYGPDGWCASGLVNLITNPGAEVNTTGAAANSGTLTRVTSWSQFGVGSFQHVGAASGGFFDMGGDRTAFRLGMQAGKTYTLSAYFRLTGALGGSSSSTARRIVLATTEGGVETISAQSAQATNAAGVTRLTLTFTVPTGATGASVRFYHGHSTGTAWWDGLMLLEGDWSANLPDYFDGSMTNCMFTGPAHASTSYNIPAVGSITLPTDPHGGLATLSSGMRVFQPIERRDMPAGTWLFDQPGTAQGRIYNATTAPGSRPAFQDFPIVFEADGLDDVIIEAQATGGTATLGYVQVIPGDVAQPYVPRLYSEELAICQRYYQQWGPAVIATAALLPPGLALSTTLFRLPLPTRLRASPTIDCPSLTSLVIQQGAASPSPSTATVSAFAGGLVQLDFTASGLSSAAAGYVRGNATTHFFGLNAELGVLAA